MLQAVKTNDAEILSLLVSLGGSVDLGAVDKTGRPVVDIVRDYDWGRSIALLSLKPSSPKGRL